MQKRDNNKQMMPHFSQPWDNPISNRGFSSSTSQLSSEVSFPLFPSQIQPPLSSGSSLVHLFTSNFPEMLQGLPRLLAPPASLPCRELYSSRIPGGNFQEVPGTLLLSTSSSGNKRQEKRRYLNTNVLFWVIPM